MTYHHNKEEVDAYIDAYHQEEERQKKQIQETEEWLKTQPVQAKDIYTKAKEACLTQGNWKPLEAVAQSISNLQTNVDTQVIPKLQTQHQAAQLEFEAYRGTHKSYLEQREATKAYIAYFDEHIVPLLKIEFPPMEVEEQLIELRMHAESTWPNRFKTHSQVLKREKQLEAFIKQH